jgi:AcrR family transcriptional regulator
VETWTLDEVLADAGLGTRSFYRHFASKDALLAAVLIAVAQEAGARLRREVEAAPSATAALTAWVDGILMTTRATRDARRTRDMLRALAASGGEATREAQRSLVSSFTEPLALALERGLVDGTFPAAVPSRDVPMIFTLTFGVVTDMGGWAQANSPEFVHDSLMRYILPALGAST